MCEILVSSDSNWQLALSVLILAVLMISISPLKIYSLIRERRFFNVICFTLKNIVYLSTCSVMSFDNILSFYSYDLIIDLFVNVSVLFMSRMNFLFLKNNFSAIEKTIFTLCSFPLLNFHIFVCVLFSFPFFSFKLHVFFQWS